MFKTIALLSLFSFSLFAANKKPSVIFILTDDQGYGDLSCYGHSLIKTPEIDNLAKARLKLTSYYQGGSWCMPSRKAIMTGIHTYRGGLKKGIQGRTILPEIFKKMAIKRLL